jgi:hypothetical protein
MERYWIRRIIEKQALPLGAAPVLVLQEVAKVLVYVFKDNRGNRPRF